MLQAECHYNYRALSLAQMVVTVIELRLYFFYYYALLDYVNTFTPVPHGSCSERTSWLEYRANK